jgi:16S rRNA C967 or C1407 C5-methylase (RsmB/RsmF family)/NOL1/NOP2/fmu family ribosome biogenesis protein
VLSQDFIKRIQTQKYIDAEGLINALGTDAPVSVRINALKWDNLPAHAEKVPWCSDGYYLGKRPLYTLDPLFHAGCYYPQEASGMFLGEAFRQTVHDMNDIKVLDLCGAPGGKATHLSSLIGTKGLLVANEVIRPRASVLAENISKWGLSNAIVTRNDPGSFQGLQGYFDVIVVDAPCSGEGMFRDIVAVNEWSAENTALCSERQKRILMDVWPALKENGLLFYSTCTFNPGENEQNLDWLHSRKEFDSIKLDISAFPGITEISFRGITAYGFYPGRVRGEGLFLSVIRKKEKQESVSGKVVKSGTLKPGAGERAAALEWTGFREESLLKIGDSVLAFPGRREDFELFNSRLTLLSSGTRILTEKNGRYLPSHDLSQSVFIKNNVFPSTELDTREALTYLGRGNIRSLNGGKGWTLVTHMGVNLGFVNNLGNRVNNYYPMEWRIRMKTEGHGSADQIVWEK